MSENTEYENERLSESDKMDISEISDQVSPLSDQMPSEVIDNQGVIYHPLLDNAAVMVNNTSSTTTHTSTAGTPRRDSALGLEGLDLELPPLDAYQEEYVDFPSSPKHLKEAPGMCLPQEGDSGTMAGRSEEEEDEEDTSIYQAVLSPNCQDVRLKKDAEILDEILAECHEDDLNSPSEEEGNRKLLSPNPEDSLLPQIYDTNITLCVDSPSSPEEKNQRHFSIRSDTNKSTTSFEDADDINNDTDFVFERRNSKRLSKGEKDMRFVEGLFVESRNKDSLDNLGLRKIPVPDGLHSLESPDINTSYDNILPILKVDNQEEEQDTEVAAKPVDIVRPTPRPRLKPSEPSSTAEPPIPKPRKKSDRGPPLLLDASKLDLSLARRTPRLNPDGSPMVETRPERPGSLVASQRGGRRKIRVSADILNGTADGDASSEGSRLSDTEPASPDDDPDLEDVLSPDLDTPDEMEESILERLGEIVPLPQPPPIPELTAEEERLEERNWRNCLVAGLERRIDMKVIEPYKRVLSHGGYLTAGSHNAIIVFSACFLPDRSRVDYDYVMDNLFLYVLMTLDQLVTEDYVLIYLHGATTRGCMPTFSWLKRCYQMIDRRLRKNLKSLYLVHPTFWLKTIVIMTRPFISSKFGRKLSFVESLADLAELVPLEQASIPDRVKQLDDELWGHKKLKEKSTARSV